GFYAKARDLSLMTSSSLLSIISKVGFYAYNAVHDDRRKLQDGFVKSLDLILLATLPVSFLFLIEGGTIISFVLGSQWLGLVVPLKILAVAVLFKSLVGLVNPLFFSVGRPDLNFKMTLFQLMLSAPLFAFSVYRWGTTGAAYAFLIIQLCMSLFAVWNARDILRFGWSRIMPTIRFIVAMNAPVIMVALVFRPFAHSFGYAVVLGWIGFLIILYVLLFWIIGYFFPRGPKETVMLIFSEVKGNLRQ
ncbi:MAG: oligosaccharide flippase family protein, partial [Patescibacteria group bacterium]